ncbi:AAA family ATPase [Vibrio parahaemolyticus]|uniref:AAA family ATPase n=1 Tax=Vibrio parahaemolyticus TaxID=670 RepID=UPI001A2147C4|nr:AAA family ATPase [Vibrio parahaemolyticus]EHR6714692.1 AAA family ATPase [Vibrio parahaemolyticus]ELA9316294.1 AAA family ATPase [Vibrio parahaemolyticus]MCG6481420.1 AAA family ATPase [Vibrio parahaemolyticus]HAS6797179.1 AAA family ATPase [Vibrio parahaemolyticus]
MGQLNLPFSPIIQEYLNNTFDYTYGSTGYEEQTEWLVKGLIPMNSMVGLVGASGSGKSFVVQELVHCISEGKPFLGKKTSQGACIVIAGEGAEGMKKRFRGVELANNIFTNKVALIPHAVLITINEQAAMLENTIHAVQEDTGNKVKVIIVDTVNRSFEGDENSPSDMGRFIQAWDRIRYKFPDMSVVFVHHTGKDQSKGARGHSSFKGALDTELMVVKGERKSSYELRNTKQKDAEEAPNVLVQLSSIELDICCDDGVPITTLALIDIPQELVESTSCPYLKCIKELGAGCDRKSLREYIKQTLHPNFTSAERTRMSKALTNLEKKGVIKVDRSDAKPDNHQIELLD